MGHKSPQFKPAPGEHSKARNFPVVKVATAVLRLRQRLCAIECSPRFPPSASSHLLLGDELTDIIFTFLFLSLSASLHPRSQSVSGTFPFPSAPTQSVGRSSSFSLANGSPTPNFFLPAAAAVSLLSLDKCGTTFFISSYFSRHFVFFFILFVDRDSQPLPLPHEDETVTS